MSKRKKAAAAAVTIAAVAGMVSGAAVDSPAQLLEEEPLIEYEQEDGTAGKGVQLKRKGIAALRERIFALPAAVRILVVLPLWCIGWTIENAIAALLMSASAPLAQRAIGWLCLGLVLLAVFAVSTKMTFPKCPLGKILRLRNVLFPLAAALLLGAADLALPTVWKGYNTATMTVWRMGAFVLLAFLCSAELKWQGKHYVRPKSKEDFRTDVEREAWRLADTVCPKR